MNRVKVAALVLMLGACHAAKGDARTVKISSVNPASIYAGDRFELAGRHFGAEQPNNITVMISGTINGRTRRYKLQVVKWTDGRIRVEADASVVPGRYEVGIYRGDETGLVSNLVPLTVLGGIVISRINPDTAHPGDTVEIHGRHFGAVQANRIVSINRLGHRYRMRVLEWGSGLIRAQIPNRLTAGRYVVLIYYDDSYRSSSDSVAVTIERP